MQNKVPEITKEQPSLTVTEVTSSKDQNKQVMPSFAEILGKSERKLKQEFYLYKVKELLQKIGLTIDKQATQTEIQGSVDQAYHLGIKDFLLTPFYYSLVKGLGVKYRKGISLSVAVDYPLGETEVKGKVAGVKEACKNGADYVMCALPEKTIKLACLYQERKKLIKCGRASKKPFGIIAKASLEDGELQKILKNTDCVKSEFVAIEGHETEVTKLKEAISTAIANKGKRKLFVIANVDTVEKLTLLMEAKIDKIFTPYANVLAEELNKFATLQS